ncbi:ABC transporter ATP-binding protein [Devosia sp. 63-57]|uniref:ABC transporter ATP-binding protein n=1 Tax=Devosia sp. 63-57 TaxID=1895751 RepID=UPI00086D61F5|nr:ABC transporter ATP-binding protein [Devosia sp. 63-57]ODT47930.1 MAG: peptide ABC transporter ATP-binding protein [Pelagibacterium sp. SCN 63-126]ODU87898.1 MAG: peptide ABC transporter ATP-binding protein [Pelagibacterium sp. SCN 63-17]OJX42360.1 MAG: peptide ABC transporter ATP-binding protein [Devosia sp. 63-57]
MSLVSVEHVSFAYTAERPILDRVSLAIAPGDSVGLVGESGSGKTTLLRLLLGLARPDSGEVRFDGALLDPGNRAFMRDFRRQAQVVFQDPYSSLDPRQKVFSIIAEPLRSLRIDGDHQEMVAKALDAVGLSPDAADRYPHQFSGGQRQRIAIARAIVPGPRLLLADEAVSALDLTTKVRIVDLLAQLSTSMSLLFVSHDIGVVAALCKRIVILEKGRIVEQGDSAAVLAAPQHPYTQRLLASVPRLSFKD